jgi:hypothetical protein
MWLLSYRTTVIRRAEISPPRRRSSSPDSPGSRPPSQPSSDELVAILEEMTMLDSTLHGTTALQSMTTSNPRRTTWSGYSDSPPGPCNETTTATQSTPKW